MHYTSQNPEESILFDPPYASTRNLTDLLSCRTIKEPSRNYKPSWETNNTKQNTAFGVNDSKPNTEFEANDSKPNISFEAMTYDTPRKTQYKMNMLNSMGFSPASQKDVSKLFTTIKPGFLSVITEKSKESLSESYEADQVNKSITVDTKNPYNQKNINSFLRRLNPPLHSYPGYHTSQQDMPLFRKNFTVTLGCCLLLSIF